ncbi:MAG: glycoside hydrolase [Chloroflexi bacterium]|nr:MAG: glycoside hydrolase [Chloroflexota bacterium]
MQLVYRNPVWPSEFADPFVLKWRGEYYAYGTSSVLHPAAPGHRFPVLHSTDLVHWSHVSNALAPLDHLPHGNYWAPEVAEQDGHFYLYFSAGESHADETQRLFVAVADDPRGPFQTVAPVLPDEGFTIDAHPFRDPADGRWYLFFAKDYFDERVGTGLAVVPLAESITAVAGPVQPILRASADWQIYERDRQLYGQRWPAWHTVEGPSVVFHEGRYYCFYSGGAWHSFDYGVSYGVAEQVLGPYRDEWSSQGPGVLRAVPGQVLGPGHNSVVRGPDDQTDFLVYHAWDAERTARRMCIDPLYWTEDGPRCDGPTIGEQVLTLGENRRQSPTPPGKDT